MLQWLSDSRAQLHPLVTLLLDHSWELVVILLLLIVLFLLLTSERLLKVFSAIDGLRNELEKRLAIEQEAHQETQRQLDIHKRGLRKTARVVQELRRVLYKKEEEIADQTEDVIRLQEWKRNIEKERSDRERAEQREQEEWEKKQLVLDSIFVYYDNPTRFPFSLLDNDRCRGTFEHVQTVAELSGAAAEKIGINPFFVRASAYFHDLGKASLPKYFKENWGYNEDLGWRKENEEYSFYHRGKMILAHLPLGRYIVSKQVTEPPSELMEILAQYSGSNEWKTMLFQEAVHQMSTSIEEHQGNTSIFGLFKASVNNGEGTTIEDFTYRSGRKPTTKANGIILLADSCDAAFEGITVDRDTDIGEIIRKVIFLKISLGLLDKTELTVRDLAGIYQAFHEFFSKKYRTGDRVEDKQVEEQVFYLENKVNPIAECVEVLQDLSQEPASRRKIAYYFAHNASELYNLKQVDRLIDLFLTDLASLGKDDIYFANILKAVSSYYRLYMQDLIEIAKEHDIQFEEHLIPKLTVADLFDQTGCDDLVRKNNRAREIIERLIQIKKVTIEAIINKDFLNKTDRYVLEEAFKIYHFLGRFDRVIEPMEAPNGSAGDSTLRFHLPEWIIPEEGWKFVGRIRGNIIEIIPSLKLSRTDLSRLYFAVYFRKDGHWLLDQNGLFRTTAQGIVGISSLFIPPFPGNIVEGLAINFPLEELHLQEHGDYNLEAVIQLQGKCDDSDRFLIFSTIENLKVSLEERKSSGGIELNALLEVIDQV